MGYPKVEVNVLEFASPNAKKAQQFNVSNNMCAADTAICSVEGRNYHRSLDVAYLMRLE